MNAAGSCLGKLEFIPIYDLKCYFMLSNHFNPTFLTCLQGGSFLWCFVRKCLPIRAKIIVIRAIL